MYSFLSYIKRSFFQNSKYSFNDTLKDILIIVVLFLSIAFLLFYLKYENVMYDATENLNVAAKKHIYEYSLNIEKQLKEVIKNDLGNVFLVNDDIKKELQNILELFSGDQYPYVYLISKDKDGKFRYLADGSFDKSQRGEFYQKFDPESKVWQESYKNKKQSWRVQENVAGVWVTYLYPVIYKNKTSFILAFDFSIQEYEMLQDTLSPLKSFLQILLVILALVIVTTITLLILLKIQRKKAIIDPLTKLYNRHFLDEIGTRIKLEKTIIAVLDLDHFKRINDIYGHDAGDLVLSEISQVLLKQVRTNDVLIRYGGEEFILILRHNQKVNESIKAIERLHKSIEKLQITMPDKSKVKITASIGINASPNLSRSLTDAIILADKMLYFAKTSGRNRIEIYNSSEGKSISLKTPEEIKQAIINGYLVPYFQPIYDLRLNKIVKYEALARIVDENGIVHPPIEFINSIKFTSTYRLLSKIMIQSAFDKIEEKNIAISINFDIGDFFDETLFEQILESIKDHENSNMLTIELLEDDKPKNMQEISKKIEKLKSLGVKIAIDDFGSGFANYGYLLGINPNILKIDGSIVQQLLTNKTSVDIVKSITALCKILQIDVVAEYVSDVGMISVLREIGVDFAQGYAIGKPARDILEDCFYEPSLNL